MDSHEGIDGESLRRRIALGETTAREVTEGSIARIEALNPVLNAFTSTCFDRARTNADQADIQRKEGKAAGGLLGLPVAIKDLNDVEGLPTTFGSPLYAENIATADDDVVANIRAVGGTILGKTNVPEHGFGATTTSPLFGPTRNPFNPALSAGASTGGGAVATAAGMVPYATGSDFAGSLRTPAAFCGIVGIRPSNGVVGTRRRSMAWSSFDVEGPMACTVADCKRLLGAMARRDRYDPFVAAPDYDLSRPVEMVDLGGLRVAVSEDLGFAPMCSCNRNLFQQRIKKIECLFSRIERTHPDLGDAEQTFMTLRSVGFAADFGAMKAEFGNLLGDVVLDELARAREVGAEQIGVAMTEHTAAFRRAIGFFEDYDILLTPAASVSPFHHDEIYPKEVDGVKLDGYLSWEGISWGITLTQCPAVVIPCGRDYSGMPFGIQIVGPHHSDGWLLNVAHTLEALFAEDPELSRPKPNLSELLAVPS